MFPFLRPGQDGQGDVDEDDHSGQGGGDHIDQDDLDNQLKMGLIFTFETWGNLKENQKTDDSEW